MELNFSCTIPCNLCGTESSTVVGVKDRDDRPLRSVICQQCGLVWTDPRPSPEAIEQFYTKDYRKEYKGVWTPKPKHVYRSGQAAANRFARLSKFLRTGDRVFDVGAGGGEMVYALRQAGYDAAGVEPNEEYARFAREVLGLDVAWGFYQNLPQAKGPYEVITLFHVLEHLEDPVHALSELRSWIKPCGLLAVEVPNVEAVCQWPGNRFHLAHLYNFNQATLELTGRKAGFSVIHSEVSSDGGNLFVMFRREESPNSVSTHLAGNFDRVFGVIQKHSVLRHICSPFPYLRPFQKLAQRWAEWRGTRKVLSAKDTLDRLLQKHHTALKVHPCLMWCYYGVSLEALGRCAVFS